MRHKIYKVSDQYLCEFVENFGGGAGPSTFPCWMAEGARSSRPWDKMGWWWSQKNFFQSFEPQLGLKIRGRGPPPQALPPGSTTGSSGCFFFFLLFFCRTKVWHIDLLEEDFLYTSSKIQYKQYHGVRYLLERGSEQWISWKPSAQKMVSDAYKRQLLKRVSKHKTFILS